MEQLKEEQEEVRPSPFRRQRCAARDCRAEELGHEPVPERLSLVGGLRVALVQVLAPLRQLEAPRAAEGDRVDAERQCQ